MNDNWASYVLTGVGLLLAGVMLAEVVATWLGPAGFAVVVLLNLVTSVPFIVVLVGGGYWLRRSHISVERHPRIVAWMAAGFGFLAVFFGVIAMATQNSLLVRVGIVRWAAAAGSGAGALVGLFEARAIDRAVAAERNRIRNEELERQNERLEKFAGIVAHDLRNPLNVASGYVELCRERSDSEELERVAASHDRMREIIDELLVLARSGRLVDETESVSLAALATESWATVDTDAATVEVADTAEFAADPDRVQHLFENLFRNATEHGGPAVTVRVGTLPDGFYVEDDGSGIPADEREAIVESGYSTSENGTGLGLAIVREVVDAHDWQLRVTEGTAGGARFEVVGVDTG